MQVMDPAGESRGTTAAFAGRESPLAPTPSSSYPAGMKAFTSGRFVGLVALAALVAACGSDPKKVEAPAAPDPSASPAPAASAAPSAPAGSGAAPAPKLTMPEMQKKALVALELTWNARDAKAYADLFAEGGAAMTLGPQGFVEEGKGRPAIAASLASFQEKVDARVKTTRILLRDELAAYEWIMVGTDKASGKKISVRGASVVTFDSDGKITKAYEYSDALTPAVQTGVVPGKAREVVLPAGEPTIIQAKKDAAEDKQLEAVQAGWVAGWLKPGSSQRGTNKAALEAATTADVVFENLVQPVDAKGRPEVVKAFEAITKAFPDAEFTINPVWSAGAYVVSSFTIRGTQKGAFGPAQRVTNKPFTLHGLEVSEIRDGKIARATWYTNGAELLGQLGLLPAKKDDTKKDEKKVVAPKG